MDTNKAAHDAVIKTIREYSDGLHTDDGANLLVGFFLSALTGLLTLAEMSAEENQEIAEIQATGKELKNSIDLAVSKQIIHLIEGDEQ